MRRQISRRLEALERAAEKEVFANALPYAVAYYLGGAKHFSDCPQAYDRALGYENLDEACRGFAELFVQSSDRLDRRLGILDRALRAHCKLFAKFGFDLRGANLAAWDDAATKIVRTLPKDWRAAITSADREWREAEAEVDQFLQQLIKLEESNACLPDQTAPRRPKKGPRAVRTKVVGRAIP